MDSEDKKDFDNVGIKTVGLGGSQQIEFLDPESQAINITKGSPANIKALKSQTLNCMPMSRTWMTESTL